MIRARILCGCLAAFGLLAVAVEKVGGAPILTIDLLPGAGLSTENTGASGRLTLAFYRHKEIDFLSLTIENTTPISLGSKLTAVGIEMPTLFPSRPVFAADGVGTYFKYMEYNVSVPPGWLNAPGGYDLALTSDRNFLGGGVHGAPGAGESHKVTLALGNTGYTPEELSIIVLRSAKLLSVTCDREGALEIASRARGTPRIANRLIKRVRDYAQVRAGGQVDRTVACEGLDMLEVDRLGLDRAQHRRPTGLVDVEMRLLPSDELVAAPAMAHQGQQVRLRTGRHEDRRILAQHGGHSLFQQIDRRIVAEHIVTHLGLGHGGAHTGRRARDGVGAEIVAYGIHGKTLRWSLPCAKPVRLCLASMQQRRHRHRRHWPPSAPVVACAPRSACR